MKNPTIGSKLDEFIELYEVKTWEKTGDLQSILNLGWDLIEEECYEAFEAIESLEEVGMTDVSAKVELLKELADVIYVATHLARVLGWDIDTAFNRVHASNLSKTWPDGTIHRDPDTGKVLKPETYRKPDLTDLV